MTLDQVADLRAALNGKTIREQAAATLASLIESLAIVLASPVRIASAGADGVRRKRK